MPETTVSLETDDLRLSLEIRDGRLRASLIDKANGKAWLAVALAEAIVHDKMERRLRRRQWEVVELAGGDRQGYARLCLPYEEISVGLHLAVEDGEVVIRMPMIECYELRGRTHLLHSVRLLSGLASVGEQGRVLLPLQSGMCFSPAGKPAVLDQFMIYGEQSRWELLPTIPLCGVAEPDAGLLLLATGGAPETECLVETDGNGNGSTGLAFGLRQFWPDPVCRDDREVRVIPFNPAKQDLINFAGHRLRRHIIDDLGKPTLTERAAESRQVQELLNSHLIRVFHGIQPIGMAASADMEGKDVLNIRDPFVPATTFAQAREGLRRLHAAGVERMHVESIGWNPRGHDGMWPTRFPIEPRIGGEAGFRELIRYGKSIGCTMNVHDNYISQYRASPDFDESIVMHDQWGTPDLRGFWGGGETYVTCPWALGEQRLDRELERVKALGLNGPGYIDGMGNPLGCSYAPGPVGTRTDYVRGSQQILEAGRRNYGALRTECGFLYACLPVDCMAQCGNQFMLDHVDPDWPIAALIEQIVPVWQLALHGLVVRENHGNTWRSAMECVMFGDHPRHEWTASGRFQPALDDAHIAAIKAKYDLCIRTFGHLQTEVLMAWHELEDGVQETRYADGTVVRGDLSGLELFVNERPVDRPHGLSDKHGHAS